MSGIDEGSLDKSMDEAWLLLYFQDLKIWQLAIEIANELFEIAETLEAKRLYRFAEQLRGAGMSMSNNTCPVK